MNTCIPFHDVPVTGLFTYNGIRWQKHGNNMARAIEYSAVRDFFKPKDMCVVGEHLLIADRKYYTATSAERAQQREVA